MDQSQTVIGTLKSPTMGVSVERMGQTLTLEPGQPVFWNDVIVNQGETLAVFELPAQSAAHGAAQLEIAPGAQAKLKAIESASTEIGPRTEVIAMTDGVELFEVSDQVNTAILTTAEGEMAGLAGVGLLAGGSALPGVALAGLGLLGLAATNDNGGDDPALIPTNPPPPNEGPAPVPTNPGPVPAPGPTDPGPAPAPGPSNPGPAPAPGPGTPGPAPAPGPTDPTTPTTPAEQLTGVSGLLVSAGDTLDEATASIPGVGMLVDAVTDVLGSGEGGVLPLPFGLADGLSELGSTLTSATADVPVVGDVLGIVGGLLGGTEPVPATPEANGLTALLVDLSNTLASSTAGTPGLEQLGAALSDVVGSGQGGLIPLPGGLADVTNLLANGLGDAVPEGIPLISGLVGTLSQVVGNNLPTEPSADLLNVGNLTSGSPLSSPLASGSALPGLDALSGLLNPLTNGLG